MRAGFRCNACSLQFTVGWLDEPPRDGYGASNQFVCRECGTECLIEVAIRDRGPSRESLFDVALVEVDESRKKDAAAIFQSRFDMTSVEASEAVEMMPMEIARSVNRQLATELQEAFGAVGNVDVKEVSSAPNLRHGPAHPDRFLSRKCPCFEDDQAFVEIEPEGTRWGPNGEFDLTIQPCAGCGARGSLVGNPMEITETCPHCGEKSVECVAEWET